MTARPFKDVDQSALPDTRAVYRETRWSLVIQAQSGSAEALESLGRIYWPPVYAFLRRRGFSPADAEDLTQDTFGRVLSTRSMSSVEPKKGKFRSFLCACADHEASRFRERTAAKKRGGDLLVPMTTEEAERQYEMVRDPDASSDQIFDRAWSKIIVARAIDALKIDYTRLGKRLLFERLVPMLNVGPERGEWKEVADALNTTEGNVRVAWGRLKASFVAQLRKEVADTVATPDEVDGELRYLLHAWVGRDGRLDVEPPG